MGQGIRIRTIILLWFLIVGTSGVQAQSSGDIDTLSQWRVTAYHLYGFEYVTEDFKYYISGSVIVDSLEYNVVYRSGISYLDPQNVSYFNHEHAGVLREHEDKWYTIDYYDEDVLLYDFTQSVGDTVDSYATFGATITIADIDTVLVDGEAKKRFHLLGGGWGNGEFIIEDVGATTGLFEALTFFESESYLHCYAIDFVPLWLNPNHPYCDLSVSITEVIQTQNLSTYPNPFTSSTTIEFSLNGKSKIQITIFNSLGEMVYQTQDSYEQGTHKVTWSAGHLPEGMYYGALRSEEGVSVVKMLKQ